MRALACALALAVSLAAPASAHVENRLFTLARGVCGPVGTFPDGGLLVVEATFGRAPARAWRLGLDGTRTPLDVVPGDVDDVVVDGPASFVTISRSAGRIARFDLASGASATLLELPDRFLDHVIALDDGSFVVYDGVRVRRTRDGFSFVAARGSFVGLPLAPLARGAFAFVDHERERVVHVGTDGRRHALMRLADSLTATLAAHGSELVVVHDGTLTRFDGLRRLGSDRGRRGGPVYGDGDGFGVAALARVSASRAWLAADGTLLLREGCTLRALVPAASPRARIALRPSAWFTFADGEIAFEAGGAGRVRLTVRRQGGAVVARAEGATRGGVGRLRLRRELPRGAFDLRLELVTAAGAVLRDRARIVTRRRLHMAPARRAVDAAVSDGGEGWETTPGRCVPRAPGHVACRVEFVWQRLDATGRRTCRGWAHARLRRDGVRVSDDDVDCGSPPSA